MHTEEDYMELALDSVTGITQAQKDEMVRTSKSLNEFFSKVETLSKQSHDHLSGGIAAIDERKCREVMQNMQKNGIDFVVHTSQFYPSKLANIVDGPRILYYMGDLSLLNQEGIAIVGTRDNTSYGAKAAAYFAKQFVQQGYCIISGLALGIDTVAHETALQCKGNTIAVVGQGLCNYYPPQNQTLYQNIVATGGVILSEIYPIKRGAAFTFPRRNRIIAALSQAVLITEAPASSGAWITAERAKAYGIPVFAVPGSIFSRASVGCNEWIARQAAVMAKTAEDVFLTLGKLAEPQLQDEMLEQQTFLIGLTSDQEKIVQLIKNGTTYFEDILQASQLTSANLNEQLCLLTIEGVIQKMAGNEYKV